MFSVEISEEKKKHKITKSSIFIREMLGYSPLFYGVRFYNCYIDIKTVSMFLVFKHPKFDKNYENVKIALQTQPEFISYVESEEYEIYNLKIPEKYEEDFLKFIKGKYSEMSKEYKEDITSLHLHTSKITYKQMNDILYPTKEKQDALAKFLGVASLFSNEVYDIPDLEEEVFNISDFIQE
jgi:hypothetical protein